MTLQQTTEHNPSENAVNIGPDLVQAKAEIEALRARKTLLKWRFTTATRLTVDGKVWTQANCVMWLRPAGHLTVRTYDATAKPAAYTEAVQAAIRKMTGLTGPTWVPVWYIPANCGTEYPVVCFQAGKKVCFINACFLRNLDPLIGDDMMYISEDRTIIINRMSIKWTTEPLMKEHRIRL